jgi:hypothetical protein
MRARPRWASVRVAVLLSAALILAPPVTRQASAQVNPPRSLTASVLGRGVTLNWQPPSSLPPGFTGYLLEAGANRGETSVSLPLGNVLTYFVIAPNGRYFVRVRALFGATPGPASNEVEVIVPPLPPAPVNVTATIERMTVTLTWERGLLSASVTGWEVHAGSASGLSDLAIVPVPVTRRTLTGTVPAGTYYVRVFALNPSGASPASEEVVVTTGPHICDLPGTPSGLYAVAGQGGVLLHWDPWSGPLPAGYLLGAGFSRGASDIGTFALPRTTGYGSLAPAATYYVRLAAYNSCGQSPFTPDVEFRVAPPGGSSLVGTCSGTVSNYSQPFPWTPITSFQLTLNANPTGAGGFLPGLWTDNKGCRSTLIAGGINILPYISIESLACNDGDFVLTITSSTATVVEGRCNAGPSCSFRMTRR